MAKNNEDELIKQGVPIIVVNFGKDFSIQKLQSYNMEKVDPRNFEAFAQAIIPVMRDFIEDPQNQDLIAKWKRDSPSKR